MPIDGQPPCKTGRPPIIFTNEIGERICALVATSHTGMVELLKRNPELPSRQTIYEWAYHNKDFGDKLRIARALQTDALMQEMIDQSDVVEEDESALARVRLTMQIRSWMASRLNPEVYGSKTTITDEKGKDMVREEVHAQLAKIRGVKV